MLSDRRISQKVGLTQTLSRRGLLKGAGTAVALGAAGGTSRAYGQNAPSKPLVYVGFGGAYQAYLEKAILRPFQKATGIEIQSVTGANNIAKLKAMVELGDVTWDIIDVTGAALGTYDAAGLLKKLDYSQITVPKLIEASVQQPSGMGYYVYSHNIWWNTSVIKGPLNSWAEVWDAKTHPGKRGFQNQAVYSPEEALLADGVPLDKVYPMDIDRIFRMYNKIRPSAVFLGLNELTNQITQGDIVTGDINLTRLQAALAAKAPLAYNWKQTLVDVERFGIPKGAHNDANAYKLMNFALQPEQQLAIIQVFKTYSPVVEQVFSKLSKEEQAGLAGSPPNAVQSLYISSSWYSQHGSELNSKFEAWLEAG